MNRITRKFYFYGDQRWFLYFVDGKPIAICRDLLLAQEAA